MGRWLVGPVKYISAYDRDAKRWHHLSVSTLQAYEDCHRLPLYDKLLGYPKPPFKPALLGQKLHGQVEHLVETGQDVLDPRIKGIRQYLPAQLPQPHVFTELGLDFVPKKDKRSFDYSAAPQMRGLPLEGYIDLVVADLLRGVSFKDLKTTSSIAKWAKTTEQLKDNLQLGVYAKVLADRYGLKTVDSGHIYAQTEGAVLVKEVPVTFERADMDRIWARAESLANGLLSLEGKTSDEGVEPTGIAHGQCSKYGGCPFRGVCLKSPEAVLKARVWGGQRFADRGYGADPGVMATILNNNYLVGSADGGGRNFLSTQASDSQAPTGDPALSLLARLTGKPTSPPPPQDTAQPVVPKAQDSAQVAAASQASWVEALCQCCGESVGKRPPGHQVAAHDGCKNPGGKYQVLGSGVKALFDKDGNPLGTRKMAIEDVKPADVAAAHLKNQGIVPPDAPANDANAVPEEKKRKTKTAPKAPPPQSAGVVAPTPPPQSDAGKAQVGAGVGKLAIRLYVNALPLHEPYQRLDEYVAWVADEVGKSLQVPDYRLTELGAVKGRGSIAALVRQTPPKPGTYVVLQASFDGPAATVVEALLPLVEFAVQGVRG